MPILRLLPLLIACVLACAAPLAAADPPRVILDSDMSSDHDDVGDIATLHGLAALGEVQIIGMMVSSKNWGTAQFMDAVNTWYGKPDIPIGIPPDIGGVGEYPGVAVGTGRWPHSMGATKEAGLASGAAMWAKDLYRKLLAASPDRSVVIITTGYLQNVEALMNSAPDAYSGLNGLDLVRQKVRLLACAGGDYPSGSEFNFRVGDTTPRPAYRVINDWPTAAWFVSYNMGQSIYTGGLLDQARSDSPIRYVYVDSNTEDYPYPSWGQQMVYVAARGLDTFWGGQTTGRNNTDTAGSNWWTATPDPGGDQEQGYLLETVRSPVRESIDALIMLEPNTGAAVRPGQPSNLRATVAGGNRIDLAWRDNAYNESGFRIERGVNGVYTQVGSVGANVTAFSDTGLASTANIAYRVKAYNATGDSRWAQTWVYSGWTEVNLASPAVLPLYSRYQPCHLRWAAAPQQYDHVVLNNDSTHGQNLSLAVDVGAQANQGVFYVYVLYQNPANWYRLVCDNTSGSQAFRFEKCINGAISTVGSPRILAQTLPAQNSEHFLHGISTGSRLREWQIQVAPGSLAFTTAVSHLVDDDTPIDGGRREVSTVSLAVSETLAFSSGLVGLGSHNQCPIWENVRFTTGATAALPPSIAAHPQNATVFDGRQAVFSVAASGTNPLSFQWRRNGTALGVNSASLTIAAAHDADEGSYTCTVSNAAGSVTSNAATLVVNPIVAPTITAQPVPTVAGIGDAVQFAVAASGTAPLTYQWKRGSTAVGGSSAVLAITGVQASDAGQYTCTVGNSAGSATSNAAALTVVAALDPLIAASALINDGGGTYGGYANTADKAFDGSTATFYDAAAANAWTGIDAGPAGATVTAIRFIARAGQAGRMVGGVFEGTNAQTSGYATLATVAAASDQVWTTVLIAGAAPCRYLRYRGPAGSACNVAEIEFRGNGGGGTVAVAPVITAQPASLTLTVGQSATFAVAATGTGPLTYQWRKGAAVVGGNSATLTIANAQVADMGSYSCTVSNSAGSATSQAAVLTVGAAAGLDPIIPAVALISDGHGSWGGTANTADKAFDGSTATFYDPTVAAAWTGIDAGAGATVTAIRWWARTGWSARMLGGVFEGAASPGGPWTALATVTAASDTAWTSAAVAGAAPWRYLRYRCAASAWCNVAEIEFRGTVGGTAAVAPAITAQPASLTVAAGATATFTVAASGTAPLSYQWRLGTSAVGGDSATLSIANAQAADAGSYTCTVSNSAGSATSAAATLSVGPATGLDPLITWQSVISDGNGTWGGTANTADKAFDGNPATFYDPAVAAAWTGVDVGGGAVAHVTAIRWWARAGWSARMLGGVFEGADNPAGPWTALGTVGAASDAAWTALVPPAGQGWRCLRYRCAAGSWCNVAEIEFRGSLAPVGSN